MAGNANKHRFEPGERGLAIDAEMGRDGRSWFATNRAVYIEEMASPENRRRGVVRGVRIDYRRIVFLREDRDGRVLVRTLQLRLPDGAEVSGHFVEGNPKLTAVIERYLLSAEDSNCTKPDGR